MKHNRFRAFPVICLAFAGVLYAAGHTERQNGPGISFAESLSRYGIKLDKSSLIEALTNHNGDVRGLAASELAEEKVKDAIPEIVRALEAEPTPSVRVNLAAALGKLGDRGGISELTEICANQKSEGQLRLTAAQRSLEFGSADCLPTVLELTWNGDQPSQDLAISLLSQFKTVAGEEEKEQIRQVIRANLHNERPSRRLAASEAVRLLGYNLAITDLRQAIASEVDESVRERMESDLQDLLKVKTR